MAFQMDLDVAFDEPTIEAAISEVIGGLNVTGEVINPHGPGGGWPIVRFTAQTEEELDKLLQRYTANDADTATFLKRSMVQV